MIEFADQVNIIVQEAVKRDRALALPEPVAPLKIENVRISLDAAITRMVRAHNRQDGFDVTLAAAADVFRYTTQYVELSSRGALTRRATPTPWHSGQFTGKWTVEPNTAPPSAPFVNKPVAETSVKDIPKIVRELRKAALAGLYNAILRQSIPLCNERPMEANAAAQQAKAVFDLSEAIHTLEEYAAIPDEDEEDDGLPF